MADQHEHPWTVRREDDDDGPPDVGDPRDMTVPSVRRGAPGTWAVHAACRCDRFTESCSNCCARRSVAAAELFAMRVEPEIRSACMTAEDAFAWHNGRRLDHAAALALDARWTYGPRFWAWWQGRQTTKRVLDECASAIGERHRETVAHESLEAAFRRVTESARRFAESDPDPRPILALADGGSVRADEAWRDPYGAGCANVDGAAYWCCPGAPWQQSGEIRPWSDVEFKRRGSSQRRVYPPPETKPRTLTHAQRLAINIGLSDPIDRTTWERFAASTHDCGIDWDCRLPAAWICLWQAGERRGGVNACEMHARDFGAPTDPAKPSTNEREFRVERAPDPTAARLSPGDQIRTVAGWTTVTTEPRPAYPHVTCEDGVWFRGAILETRKKPSTNTHGVDVSRIAVGDYVTADGKWWHLVESIKGGDAHTRWSNGLHGIERLANVAAHRPAPRITLPDGREVAVERMWRFQDAEYANADGRGWSRGPGGPWVVRGGDFAGSPFRDCEVPGPTWPPPEVEGA